MWALLCCVAAAGGVATGTTADCNLTIDGDNYREETLVSDIVFPKGLAVEYATNLLYFRHERNNIPFAAKFDLSTRELIKIKELTGWCTFAVDQTRQEVHAGCDGHMEGHGGGLYQFDSNVGGFELAGEMGRDVYFAYYSDALYYAFRGSNLLHAFRKGHSSRVPDVPSEVVGFVVDKHKNWIFYNSTGLYQQRPGAAGATRYEGINNPWSLAVDRSGDAYVSDWGNGVYRLHEWTPMAIKFLDVMWCVDLTFDRDNNMIFVIYDNRRYRIVRLAKC